MLKGQLYAYKAYHARACRYSTAPSLLRAPKSQRPNCSDGVRGILECVTSAH
jgi:hypothetical protein